MSPAIRRKLQQQLQELEVSTAASSTIQSGIYFLQFHLLRFLQYLSELREAVETYKTKAESYLGRLEAAEVARVKSARAEAFGTSKDF